MAGDLELGVGQGGSCATTDEILGLVTKMSEIRAFEEVACEILSICPVSACSGERCFAENDS